MERSHGRCRFDNHAQLVANADAGGVRAGSKTQCLFPSYFDQSVVRILPSAAESIPLLSYGGVAATANKNIAKHPLDRSGRGGMFNHR
jgi:hypothetical protein